MNKYSLAIINRQTKRVVMTVEVGARNITEAVARVRKDVSGEMMVLQHNALHV